MKKKLNPVDRRTLVALSRLRPFWWWLFWFYAAWFTLVTLCSVWGQVADHWPIAVAMAAGSYVAGSTPMGGGTVGFPILVLLFNEPASLGRSFSYCIQSIGMSSATVFLLSSRAPIAWRPVLWTMATTTICVPLTLKHVAPLIEDIYVKLLFAGLWAAFGIMTLVKVRDFVRSHHAPRKGPWMDAAVGVSCGIVGGVSTGVTGVGVDMVLYTALVLLYRCELRVAIGSSVMVMAYGSLIGVISSSVMNRLTEEVLFNWVAAAPIVALGAPLGVLMMRVIPRGFTLVFVSVLCLIQFVWTLVQERPSLPLMGMAIACVLGANLVFHLMYKLGHRLTPEKAAKPKEPELQASPCPDADAGSP